MNRPNCKTNAAAVISSRTIPANTKIMTNTNRYPAIFLDRDGTIIEDRGYLFDPSQVVFYPPAIPALRRLCERFRLFVITHQSGIAKGINTREEVDRVNAYMVEALEREGVKIEKVYYCPHVRAENCDCVKPKPFFPLLVAREYNIDLTRSWVIGDHPHDAEMAAEFGGRGLYVLTGHGRKHQHEISDDYIIAADLSEAADIILGTKAP